MQKHRTSKQEIESLRKVVERDLQDASLKQLSADRRFATAYNAVLQSATIAVACSGYRVTAKTGHHRVTIACLRIIFGKSFDAIADYLETCRRKRNVIDYMHSHLTSETEAEEILRQAKAFARSVEAWVRNKYPALA